MNRQNTLSGALPSTAPPSEQRQINRDSAAAPVCASRALRPTQVRFVEHYMLSLNATDAYRKVHPTVRPATARSEGHKTLTNPNVAAEIARRQAVISERTNATVEKLVRWLWQIVQADPNELVSWRVGCCRYCHGIDHRHQRTDGEYSKELAYFEEHGHLPIGKKRKSETADEYAAHKLTSMVWDEQGGPGFDARRSPHPDCPECFGEGRGRMVLGDTRNLSPEARPLFAGVKKTKEGIEVLTHDKMAAIEKLMRHLGAYEKDNNQKGTGDLAALLDHFGKGVALPIVANPSGDELT